MGQGLESEMQLEKEVGDSKHFQDYLFANSAHNRSKNIHKSIALQQKGEKRGKKGKKNSKSRRGSQLTGEK